MHIDKEKKSNISLLTSSPGEFHMNEYKHHTEIQKWKISTSFSIRKYSKELAHLFNVIQVLSCLLQCKISLSWALCFRSCY